MLVFLLGNKVGCLHGTSLVVLSPALSTKIMKALGLCTILCSTQKLISIIFIFLQYQGLDLRLGTCVGTQK